MNINFLARCLSTPWAMEPGEMRSYAALLAGAYRRHELRASGAPLAERDYEGSDEPRAAKRETKTVGGGNIAVIPIAGPIYQRASDIGMCEAGTSCDRISAQFRAALADESVGQILLDISSPGGSVFGVMELADEIRASSKPVVAFANAFAASAAYWLATAAGELWMMPSGQVGSIGVYMAHEDVSKALEDAGVKVTLISAGDFKVEGNPFSPLDENAAANMQAAVNQYYGQFVAAVAQGRNTTQEKVLANMGQGRMLLANDAKAANMVDGIGTFDDVVSMMQKRAAGSNRKPGLARAEKMLAIG